MADMVNGDHWDRCVYRLSRAEFEAIERTSLGHAERLTGLEVRVIEDAEPDTVFIIDVRAMRDAVDEMFDRHNFSSMVGYDLAWRARLDA